VRVALAAAGTGGHVYPALAVAEEIRRLRPGARLLFIGGDRLEATLVPASGYPFRAISAHGLAGRGLFGWTKRVRAGAELLLGIPLWQSLGLLREFRPQVVIGTGGYVSGPVLLAARLMRLPSLAVEGNRTPGRTSRLVAKMVEVVAVAWPELEVFFGERVRRSARVILTGLPIRSELVAMTREGGAAALGLDPAKPTLVVFGGSLGSRRVNEALVGALRLMAGDERLREVQVLHATGRRNPVALSPEEARDIAPGYRSLAYLGEEYAAALAAADLVVSRAGASTVAELTARGLPAILSPWAGAATDEQSLNAAPMGKVGAAVVIPDAELTPQRLAETLSALLWDGERRRRMARASNLLGKPRAAEAVAKLALELAEGPRGSGKT
jgi:UDP-N-acetylglucosamine--N-acetylmuramyl-(pentapeptide) pyrophosphoryl-undecaprenol N-acetylglucosamine transferase